MAFVDESADDLATMAVYGVAIAVYAVLVAMLYVPLGTRMMFARRFGDRRIATPARRFAYVLAFPLISFLFFLLIAASMLFVGAYTSSTALTPRDVMTIAMGVVLAIRVCAYFSETAAVDLAKTLPLTMLAVALVTNGLSDLQASVDHLRAFADEPGLLGAYFLVVVVVEFLLRAIYEALGRPGRGRDPRDPSPGLQKRPPA